MKTIAGYLHDYFREEWNPGLFLSIAILLAVSFAINYGLNFESMMLKRFPHPLQQFTFYFFFYGIPYGATLGLSAFTTGKRAPVRDTGFVLLVLSGIALLAGYITLHNLPMFLYRTAPQCLSGVPHDFHWYAIRYASNLLPGFVAVFPIALYWHLRDRSTSRLYGFSASNINLKTYFAIITLLAPIVFAASFSPDFQSAYPRYKFGLPPDAIGMERVMLVGGFALCYGIDFVFVELLFRGFMVMAFARHLGSRAILPMVVAYAFIHFQKPIGEALGSIVGGLVLGVISSRTRSIYGGIIVHLGVAFLMEIAGTLQLLLK